MAEKTKQDVLRSARERRPAMAEKKDEPRYDDESFAAGYTKAMEEAAEDGKPKPLTIEDVRKMSIDDINSRWDEVKNVLEESGR